MSISVHLPAASLEAKRVLLAERLRRAAGGPRQTPLSFAQQRLWFLDQLAPNSPLYNIAILARLSGNLNVSALEQALQAIVARHESLRTRFVLREDTPVQVIERERNLPLRRVELASSTPAERQAEARGLIRDEVGRPFKLGTDTLARATLFRLDTEEHWLLLVIHHIVADEWSLKIIFRELAALYEGFVKGGRPSLPDLAIQYADYAVWQRNWLSGESLERQLRYWKEHLGGNPPVLELPADHPRVSALSARAGNAARNLGQDLSDRLRETARAHDATLFLVLLAGFEALLYRHTGQEDLVLASPIAGRNRVETEGLVGFFVNTLALRTSLARNPTFEQLLDRVRQTTLGAFAHQDVPFERLVQELQPERTLGQMPFSRLMFVVQSGVPDEYILPGLRLQVVDVEGELAKFDLTLVAGETREGLVLRAEYNRDLFEAATIERLLEHFEILLAGVVAGPNRRISDLPLLSERERHHLLVDWNRTTTEYPRDKCIHQLFEAQVLNTPAVRAVAYGTHAVTYGELNARANQLAHYLRGLGIGPEVPVAICVQRSVEMVVGLLAILKAGGTYVPLDPSYPAERLEFMLNDTSAPVLLTLQHLRSKLPVGQQHRSNSVPRPLHVICLDTDWELIARESRENPANASKAEHLAYVMYTSGSTGRPKGVAVPHRGVNRLVLNSNYIRLDATDRIAQVSNVSFDAATFEIWGALLNGGQLVGITRDVALSPKDFARELREQGITAMFLTAALFNQLSADVPGAFALVRTLIVGGDALDPKWVRAVLRRQPPQRLVNGYGPTENTTFTCCFEIRDLAPEATHVSIGRPIANTQVYILDAHLNPVPIGVPGELYTGGDGLARGYWNRPELTAEKFIPNPFGNHPELNLPGRANARLSRSDCEAASSSSSLSSSKGAEKAERPDDSAGSGTAESDAPRPSPYLYKTGDLARYLPDGNIQFLGRLDQQVKVRGFRIEPGEVENALGQHPGVQECVVTARGGEGGVKQLVAYLVARDGSSPSASELRAFLSQTLPDYMVPSAFVTLRTLPLTANGKVDRQALPAPDHARPELDRRYVAPRDQVEQELVGIWEQVLGRQPVGIADKFFDLGGHSLLAVQLVARIEKAFGRKLRLATVFQAPTIEQLAAILRGDEQESNLSNDSAVVEIQSRGTRPPLYFVHGAGGGMFWGYTSLARHLGADQPVFGFQCSGLRGHEEPGRIEDMAARYAADLRRTQPHGPYYLGGYCFGGIVAYEMARQLCEAGAEVALLALLNCAPPNSPYTRIPWTLGWARRFARNLLYWTNYFRQWSPTQRREFLRWKWRLLQKRLARWREGPMESSGLDAGELVDLSSYTEEQRRVWEAHIQALLTYHPQPYAGRVHLFRSPGHPLWCSFDPNYGWGDLALGGVERQIVPGAHEKIMEEPCVEALACELAKALRKAQSGVPLKPGAAASLSLFSSSSSSKPLAEAAGSLAYWKQQLAGAPALLSLPADHPRPDHWRAEGARHAFSLPRRSLEALERLSRERGCDLFSTLLAGWATLLHRYTRSTDIVVGSVFNGRSANIGGNTVGQFDNLVALRCDTAGDPRFSEFLGRVHRVSREAFAHADVPFAALLDHLSSPRNASHAPLFQVLFVLEEDLLPQLQTGDLEFVPFEIDTGTAKFDLTLRLARGADGLSGWIEFSTALFEAPRISRLAEHFTRLLEGVIADPARRLSALTLLSEAQRRQILFDWNRTGKEYPNDETLVSLFEAQAARTPQGVALVGVRQRWTYAQLDARARQIALALRELGAGRDTLVGICLERGPDMVAAMLGVLKARAAYVPLDPAYPKERLAFILQDAKVPVLLTQEKLRAGLPATAARVLCLDDLPDKAGTSPAHEEVLPPPGASDLAYIIYTSGSTGAPKGVALEHRGAAALVHWARDTFSAEDLSGVLASTSICFDLSIFEIFVPVSWGGKVILAPNAMALGNLPAAGEVTLINMVPSAIRALLQAKAVPPSVRVINLAGELLEPALVEQVYRETSARKVFDLYGPSETTTYSTFALRQPGAPATIGRPLSNEQVYLLDHHLEPVPIGVAGEVFIGGVGVARGYLNQPELTARKFIANPFRSGERLYRTGDLARWRADGNLEFLGRLDHQVKLRGFRIELGEIEAVLKAHPGVREAVVLVREDVPGDQRLVAYAACDPGLTSAARDLRRMLQAKLPDYMVPSAFVILDKLPLTPNGKVDRKALPVPVREGEGAELAPPCTPVEAQLAAIWREVLGLEKVGVHDNFFELGGHSLLAVQILSRVREVFGRELPLFSVFTTPTIAELAEAFATGDKQGGEIPLLSLPVGSRFGAHPVSFVQERLWFLEQLRPGTDAYHVRAAFRIKGQLDCSALERAVGQIVQRHDALRTAFQYADNQLAQTVAPDGKVEFRFLDLRCHAGPEREAQARQWLATEGQRPFELTRAPLLRTGLVRLTDDEHFFLLTMHHAISDGWSLAIFFQELEAFYDAETGGATAGALPDLPVRYVDFAHWQRQWMQGDRLEQQLAYWREALAGTPRALDLPFDNAQAMEAPGPVASASLRLDLELFKAVRALGRQEAATPFMVLLTALALTLYKWTGQQDLVLGTVVAGRNRRQLENVIGCFMNFLPLRLRFSSSETGAQVLARVRATVLEGQTHQDCPFERIVEAIKPERRLNQNPLYNVALLLQNFPAEIFRARGLQITPIHVAGNSPLLELRFEAEAVQEDVFGTRALAGAAELERAEWVETEEPLAARENRLARPGLLAGDQRFEQRMSLNCEYGSNLFHRATVDELLASFHSVLETLVRQPQSKIEDLQISRALVQQAEGVRDRQRRQTLAVSATFTAEPLAEPLRYWMKELELPAVVEFAPYNQIFQQLLDPASLLSHNGRGLNIVCLRLQDWQQPTNLAQQANSPTPEENLQRNANDFVSALKAAAARHATPYLVCLCPPSQAVAADPERAALVARVEQLLIGELSRVSGVYLVTAGDLARWYPVADSDDPSAEGLGHVPYTSLFFTALATAIARKFHALLRPATKVIALDCDQTLWAGVCGEDGPRGVQLDRGRQALQEFMRRQHEDGVLLCLCSKNNEEDALAVFAARPEMPLKREHFAACRLNWQPKSENLKALAQELNVGLDSFVLVDDNPVECAEVEANCPEVLTLQLPAEADAIPNFLNHCWVFDHVKLTDEDRRRTQRYEQNREREQFRLQAPSLADFLGGLELRIEFGQMSAPQLPRVAQLTQRTNQFNCNPRRLGEGEVQQLLSTGREVLTVQVSDRFGDYGLVGVVIYQYQPEALEVESLLLSCRVLGRGIEHRVLARLGAQARARGAKRVDVRFTSTTRNKPALDFLEGVGIQFKEPSNGEGVFRFPADFAANITFCPASPEAAPVAASSSATVQLQQEGGAGSIRKFAACRAISLEANDVARIHERIEAQRKPRALKRSEYIPAHSEMERQLCAIWERLLRVERVGLRDNFFELGGHSLLAVRLFAEVEKITGRKFPLVTLFQAPTLEELAAVFSEGETVSSQSLLVSIQGGNGKPPMFLVHGAGGDVVWGYANLAAHLPADQPVYGIKSRGQVGLEELGSLNEMAACYLGIVRGFQPQGPYYLGGYCFGGNVAYEMARQLEEQGQQVALVALLDSSPSGVGYETVPWWRPSFGYRFARNFSYWARDFAALQAEERRRFMARKLRALGRKWKRRLRPGCGPGPVDLEDIIDLGHFPEKELKLWQIHLQALVNQRDRSYTGRVTLLRTRGQPLFCSLEEDFCWGKLAQGGVEVKQIPGAHENVFMEPNVKALAKALSESLAEAQARHEAKDSALAA